MVLRDIENPLFPALNIGILARGVKYIIPNFLMPKLVVIAGPACSGKMPLARALMARNGDLVLVHRDHLRASFESAVDEAHITLLMGDLARGILRLGRSPIVVAWNLEQFDRDLWDDVSDEFLVPLIWLDTREPAVAAMIPPMEAAAA